MSWIYIYIYICICQISLYHVYIYTDNKTCEKQYYKDGFGKDESSLTSLKQVASYYSCYYSYLLKPTIYVAIGCRQFVMVMGFRIYLVMSIIRYYIYIYIYIYIYNISIYNLHIGYIPYIMSISKSHNYTNCRNHYRLLSLIGHH